MMTPDADVDAPPPITVDWASIAQQQWVMYALSVIFLGMVAVQIAPGMAGRWRTAVETWTDSRRRTKTEAQAADVAGLQAQINTLQSLIESLQSQVEGASAEMEAARREARAERAAHDRILMEHAIFDRRQAQMVIDLGGKPLAPPPLWPDTTEGGL